MTCSFPAVLTIAGSDSGGGAGIQADLKTFTALGCYGTSVVTALTAQNTKGVQAVHPVPSSFVDEQLRSVLDDINITTIKTGMLANESVVRTIAQALKAQTSPLPPLVIDPVCVSTSGHTLLEYEALNTLVRDLIPLATVITPNIAEAALLLKCRDQHQKDTPEKEDAWSIISIEDMLRVSRELCALLGSRSQAVLLKGGHMARGQTRLEDVQEVVVAVAAAGQRVYKVEIEGELVLPDANMDVLFRAVAAQDPAVMRDVPVVVDVLCEKEERQGEEDVRYTLFVRPYLDSNSTHGTGCTLSAALACALARGDTVAEAVKSATMYTYYGIATAFPVGHGHGPLNHMHSTLPRTVQRPTQSDPYPLVRMLIRSNADIWKQYVEHDFVRQLGQGTLSRERFVHFIKQDYLYLKYYARANGLLAAKSSTYADFVAAADTVLSIAKESKMHVAFSAQWGVDLAELECTPESPACTAYGAYIMNVGLQGDAASLIMALAACLIGYGQVGLWLQREAAKRQPQSWMKIENNPYRNWIEDYSGESYQSAVKIGIERIEALAIHDPPSPKTLENWKMIWERCTRLEKGFWDMAMNLS